jgi:putative FmdB family regulatory protein
VPVDGEEGLHVPIYEYVCQGCRHQFEVKQKFSDDPISSCVRCGQAVTKIISAPAIMFKGSGWYVTDYSDKMKAPDQSGSAQSGEKSTNGKSDQKTQPATSGSEAASPSSGTAAPSTTGGEAGSKTSSTPPTTPAASTPSS